MCYVGSDVATHRTIWLHITSSSLSTLKAVPRTGTVTTASMVNEWSCVERRAADIDEVDQHHNLMIRFYDDKHALYTVTLLKIPQVKANRILLECNSALRITEL